MRKGSSLRRLIGELAPYKLTYIVVILTGVLYSLATGGIAIMIKTLIENFEAQDFSQFLFAPAVIMGLTLIASVNRYYNMYLSNYVTDQVTVGLRKRLQQKFMSLSSKFHSDYSAGSGGLMSRMLSDVQIIQQGMGMIADFFREPVLMVILLGWLFYLDWQLTLIIFIGLPLILAFLRSIAKSLRKYGHRSQTEMETLTSTLKESLDGVRVIQSFNLEDEMVRRFNDVADRYLENRKMIQSRTHIAGPVTETLATAIVVGIFIYIGMNATGSSTATLGTFVSYMAALLGFQKPIKKLQESFVKLQQTIIASERIFSILDEVNEVEDKSGSKEFPSNWNTIRYQDVSFYFGDKQVLDSINLEIKKGEVVAFVGESGSGKSTLVNLLERFYDPSSGQISIDDEPITNIKLKDLRQNIALVTQDVFLFNDSVSYNIHAGDLEKSKDKVHEVAKAANADHFILSKSQGYDTRVGERGASFSGGERQRLSIARALFKNAPILILDEATSALDSSSELEVQKGLEHLMEGRTTLVIAHRLSTITKADKIVVMGEGRILEVGTHDELIAKQGAYQKLHSLQRLVH